MQENSQLEQEIQNLRRKLELFILEYEKNKFSKVEITTKDIQFNGGVGFYKTLPITQQAHIANPSGGGTADAESRTAINAILVVLENLGLIKKS